MKRVYLVLLALCLTGLTGCHHRAPKALVLPPAPPEIAPVMVSVPPPTHPTEPLPVNVPVANVPSPVVVPPKRHRRRKYTPAPSTAAAPTQVAVATPPAIELGQLSAGGETGSALRTETEATLTTQKQRLDHLTPSVAAAHPADVEQARRFLKAAEDAWKTSDIEGAHTLIGKAKVLLDDLSK